MDLKVKEGKKMVGLGNDWGEFDNIEIWRH